MIQKSIRKNKCNVCLQLSEYVVSVKKQKTTARIYLCGECLKEMYFDISKHIVPRSPRNILNKFNNKEK